jgi:hypothetical protein
MSNYTHYIGIDPGTITGMVIYDKSRKAIDFIMSGTLLECQYCLQTTHWWNKIKAGQMFVRMEDARLRTWIPRQKTETAERGRREGAGYVKAHCAIWEDFCKIWGIPYELVAPKNNKTKVKSDYFKKLSGYQERTNDHERDAGMLVIGY